MAFAKLLLKITTFPNWQIVCIAALGAALRFYQIGAEPLWFDEACSYLFAQRPLHQLWGIEALGEANPPLYYTLLKLWMVFFGESETALRSLSASIGTITIPILYLLGRVLDKRQLGTISAFLLAISPINIQFSQEARAYTLLTAAVVLALLGLAMLLKDPAGARMPIGQAFVRNMLPQTPVGSDSQTKPMTNLGWLTYIAGMSVAFYAHSTAVFLLGISSVSVSTYWLRTLQLNRTFFWNWIVANGIVLSIWAWWLTFMLQQTQFNSWIPSTTLGAAIRTMNFVLIEPGREPEKIFKFFRYGLSLGLAMLGLWRWRKHIDKLMLINSFLVGFPLIVFVISLYRPIFLARVFLWITIPLFILIASGILALRSRYLTIFIIALLFFLQLRGTVNYYHTVEKESLDEVASYVAPLMKDGDKVLFYPKNLSIQFNYYLRDSPVSNVQYGLVEKYSETKRSGFDNLAELSVADIPDVVSTSGRVWFVREHAVIKKPGPIKHLASSILSELKLNMHQIESRSRVDIENSGMDVLLFEP